MDKHNTVDVVFRQNTQYKNGVFAKKGGFKATYSDDSISMVFTSERKLSYNNEKWC